MKVCISLLLMALVTTTSFARTKANTTPKPTPTPAESAEDTQDASEKDKATEKEEQGNKDTSEPKKPPTDEVPLQETNQEELSDPVLDKVVEDAEGIKEESEQEIKQTKEEDKPTSSPSPTATPSPTPIPRIVWERPEEPTPTKEPPNNWRIEVFRDKKFTYRHSLKDGTPVVVEVSPFILTPSNTNLLYFLEPGYNPEKELNIRLGEIIQTQNTQLEQTIIEMEIIASQLEGLRQWSGQ